MNLSLAAASERISGMEAALGTPLLERAHRGVHPTAAGDALVRHARLIVSQVAQMRGELRSYGSGLRGRIRLLCNTAALTMFLPGELCRFLTAHPDLSVDVEGRPSTDIALGIAQGRAELGIAADIADLAALQTHLLAQDQLVVVANAGHRIAGEARIAFADIVDEPFVGVSDAALEIHLAERASRLGRALNYRTQLKRLRDVGMLVEAGVGIAILSESSAMALRRPGLAIMPLAEPWALRHLYLCARDFRALARPADLLARQLMQAKAAAQ